MSDISFDQLLHHLEGHLRQTPPEIIAEIQRTVLLKPALKTDWSALDPKNPLLLADFNRANCGISPTEALSRLNWNLGVLNDNRLHGRDFSQARGEVMKYAHLLAASLITKEDLLTQDQQTHFLATLKLDRGIYENNQVQPLRDFAKAVTDATQQNIVTLEMPAIPELAAA